MSCLTEKDNVLREVGVIMHIAHNPFMWLIHPLMKVSFQLCQSTSG